MQSTQVTVPNMSCGHCKMRIEKTLNGLDGVLLANAEVSAKAVSIQWDDSKVTWGDIQASLENIGYPPEG